MAQIGNKQNSTINGEWGAHICKGRKRATAKVRRAMGKKLISTVINLLT